MIRFHTENISFNLANKLLVRNWIKNSISNEGKSDFVKTSRPSVRDKSAGTRAGNINIIFCNDEYLLEINKNYLNHNFYTDVIAFSYNAELSESSKLSESCSGDIFISIDRVKENAIKYDVPFENELYRVIIHGVLHLLGYNDKKNKETAIMRRKEDFYLSLLLCRLPTANCRLLG